MKAIFLKRSELENGDVMKLIFSVPAGSAEAYQFKRGETYEIGEVKDVLVNFSPQELLELAQKNIAKAVDMMDVAEETVEEVVTVMEKPETCGTCANWTRGEDPLVPEGKCGLDGLDMLDRVYHISHHCFNWVKAA